MSNDAAEQGEDIQDVISNDESLETLKPIPDFIKYGAMVGGILLLLIILGFIFSSSDENDINNALALVDIEDVESADPVDDIENSANTVDFQKSHSVDSVSSLDKISLISKVGIVNEANEVDESDLLPMTANSVIKLKLTKLEEQLNQLITENNQRQHSQDLLISDLKSQIFSQTVQIDQLQNNSKARKSYARTKKKKSYRYKTVTLPFTLVSVDQWGDNAYAVVRLYGQLHELTVGQSVDNGRWQVKSIDRFGRMAVFTNNRGVIKELFVKS